MSLKWCLLTPDEPEGESGRHLPRRAKPEGERQEPGNPCCESLPAALVRQNRPIFHPTSFPADSHQRIAMNSAKVRIAQLVLNHLVRLRHKVAFLPPDDPSQTNHEQLAVPGIEAHNDATLIGNFIPGIGSHRDLKVNGADRIGPIVTEYRRIEAELFGTFD